MRGKTPWKFWLGSSHGLKLIGVTHAINSFKQLKSTCGAGRNWANHTTQHFRLITYRSFLTTTASAWSERGEKNHVSFHFNSSKTYFVNQLPTMSDQGLTWTQDFSIFCHLICFTWEQCIFCLLHLYWVRKVENWKKVQRGSWPRQRYFCISDSVCNLSIALLKDFPSITTVNNVVCHMINTLNLFVFRFKQ